MQGFGTRVQGLGDYGSDYRLRLLVSDQWGYELSGFIWVLVQVSAA